MTANCPKWLVPRADRTGFDPIPERAALVQRMFLHYERGSTVLELARSFNAEGVPTWGGAKEWGAPYVRKILTSVATIGTLEPGKGKSGRRRPPPVADYFPRVVTQGLYDAVQKAMRERRGTRSGTTIKKWLRLKCSHVLADIGRCCLCGGVVTLAKHGTGTNKIAHLVCAAARNGRGCEYISVPLGRIEIALFNLANIATLQALASPPSDSDDTSSTSGRREQLLSEWAALEVQAIDAEERSAETHEQEAEALVAKLRRRQSKLAAELANIDRQTAAQTAKDQLSANLMRVAIELGKLSTLRHRGTNDAESIGRANSALRAVLSKIVIRPKQDKLDLHWLHGGVAVLEML